MAQEIYLIDTNVLSNSSKSKPHPRIARWVNLQERLAIPFTAFLEMEIGIVQRRQDCPQRSRELREWMDGLINVEFEYPIPTPAVARTLAELMCCGPLSSLALARNKNKKPGQDLFLAAIAIEYKMPIATCDFKDFALIGRHFRLPPVYNPAFDTFLSTAHWNGRDTELIIANVA
jgi:predicted nucleic acid-binding protein